MLVNPSLPLALSPSIDVASIRIFLPSLLRTVSEQEWKSFKFRLFVQSITEGADYFYQLNDDAELCGEGWVSAFVNKLQSWNNIGVVGPKDYAHERMLLTQSFVHRTHYEIFGKLYPHEIKDAYSDDWMTKVYGSTRSHQFPVYTMKNHNDKRTRYQFCGNVNLDYFLGLGKSRIKAFEDR
jgi:hypothetical protein